MTSYSNFDASGVTTRTTADLTSAADDTTVVALSTVVVLSTVFSLSTLVSSSTQNISLDQIIPTKIDILNINTTPSLMSDLPLIFLIVLCVLFFSIILVSSCACCLCMIRKRRVAEDVNDDIYMDVTNIVSKHSLSADSTYQDLNTPTSVTRIDK